MDKQEKLKEIYDQMSTPDEKIIDLLEKIDKEKLRGEDGKTPIKGEDYFTDEDMQEFKEEVTPKKGKDYFDGKTPTQDELLEMIKSLIPEAIPGKDGLQITPEEVRDKLKELKGKDKLSVLDLKDLEWLKSKEGMQWSSAGFKVYTDTSLTGDGSFGNPLKVSPSDFTGFVPYTGATTDVDLGLHNLTVDTNTLFVDSVNHRVGIGTTTPLEKLDVSGKIALDGTVIAYRPTAFTGTLILGDGGTNLLHSSGFQGYYNTFVGIGAGNANTTGSQNTANGLNSLVNNTTGSNNTAYGSGSLNANTTGNGNTASGYASLVNNTTGINNIAYGVNSGRFLANGSTGLTSSNNSIFLGFSTRALADNSTNEIVIGANAIGNGSNTVTLGHTSITKTILRGNVGINTTTPGSQLQINASSATTIGQIVRGFASQTADLQQWQDSAGTVLSVVDKNGNVGIGTNAPVSPLQIGTPSTANSVYDIPTMERVTGLAQSSTDQVLLRLNRGENVSTYYPGTADFKLGSYGAGGGGTGFAPATRLTIALKSTNTFNEGANVNVMTLLDNGNVGIGTTMPGAQLHVGPEILGALNGGYMGSALFTGRGSNGNNSGLFVAGASNLATSDRPLVGSVRSRGTLLSPSAVQGGDQLFSFLPAAYDGLSLQYPAMIDFNVDGTVSSGIIPTSIDFITGSNSANRTSRLRITSGGNVGIGITTPASKLTVSGHIGTKGTIPILSGSGAGSSITLGSTDTAGEITEGTLATGAIITFANAYATVPFISISSQAGLVFSYTVSTTAITITNIGALSSTKLSYHVISND